MMVDRSRGSQTNRELRNIHLNLHARLDLLHGLLPPDKKQEALDHLAVCPICAELFRRRFAHLEALRSGKVPKTEEGSVARIGSSGLRRQDSVSGLWRRVRATILWPPARYIGILAGAAAVLLLVHPILREDRGDGLQVGWLPPVGERITLRDPELADEHGDLTAGFEAYARHDPAQAIELLTGARASGSYEILRKIYLGSALAWEGEHEQAVSVLLAIDLETLPEDYDEALWALYVSLRNVGRQSTADSLLHDLLRRGHNVAERARSELE